ncbi:MAG: hypothetical protein WDO71_28630 [Bacteroidota bacterium]
MWLWDSSHYGEEKKFTTLFSDCFGLSSAFFMIQHSPGSPRKDGDSDTLMVSRNAGVSVFASLAEMIFEMYYLLPASRSNLTIRCRVPSLLKGNVSTGSISSKAMSPPAASAGKRDALPKLIISYTLWVISFVRS